MSAAARVDRDLLRRRNLRLGLTVVGVMLLLYAVSVAGVLLLN